MSSVHFRHFCGNDPVAARNLLQPSQVKLTNQWKRTADLGQRANRPAAEAAVDELYRNARLPPPRIRWWQSPVAMVMAHEMHAMGSEAATAFYGPEVITVSPEMQSWLLTESRTQLTLGQPIGFRSCRCRGASLPSSALECPRLQGRMSSAMWEARRDTVDRALVTLLPVGSKIDQSLSAVRSVFEHALCRTCDGGADRPCQCNQRSLFGSDIGFWLDGLLRDIAALEITAAFDQAPPLSCLTPYVALAQSAHLALLREQECWLSEPPSQCHVDNQGWLHAEATPALTYADGTQLYGFRGKVLPTDIGALGTSIDLDTVDQRKDPHGLRTAMLKRYGVPRYLRDRGARIVEQVEDAKLWELAAGSRGTVRILEERIPILGMEASLYSEHSRSTKSVKAALKRIEEDGPGGMIEGERTDATQRARPPQC
jgi:hypothetical protein